MSLELDHLVVAASTLDQGVAWCRETLGVEPGPGGRHPTMGTHNRLLRIDGAGFDRAYLEILAIDPDARAPGRARWFGMDLVQPDAPPCLIHWVARTPRIERPLEALRAVGIDAGSVIAASRETPEGLLQWRIAVREDGELMIAGVVPTLIEWGARHPTASMPATGVALQSLTLGGLPTAVSQALDLPSSWLGAADHVPRLEVSLQTPRGTVVLRR